MKFLFLICFSLLFLPFVAVAGTDNQVAAEIGKPAPDFTVTDTHGKEIHLSSLKGAPVVLEWTNHECPYVRKHYSSGTMQELQLEATNDGVVWLSIVSSAQGKEGYVTPEEANTITEEKDAHPTHKILDMDGAIGHLYGAKTTPHMFVIDKDGTLVYAGAIDSNPSFTEGNPATDVRNYVRDALASLKEGKPVEVPSTNSYGCGIKY